MDTNDPAESSMRSILHRATEHIGDQLQAVYSGVCLENAGSKGEFCAEDRPRTASANCNSKGPGVVQQRSHRTRTSGDRV